ncbi:Serum paraoxonase/arylesterase 2 [Geranomyces michiganensis]|nr:Serum paraoxonase/arylesterase 2 [Geranomyces michiganensis]
MIMIKPLFLASAVLSLTSGVFAQYDTIFGAKMNAELGPTANAEYKSETVVDLGIARLYVANVGQVGCKVLPTGGVGIDSSKPVMVEDLVMDRTNKIAFMGSDPYRLKTNASGGWMPGNGNGFLDAAYGAKGNGAIFTYAYGQDTTGIGAGTTKLTISPPLASFHPHGLKALPQADGSTLLFVVNHRAQLPYDPQGLYSVIEVLKYDRKVSATTLQHIKTIQDPLIWTPNNVVPMSATSFYVSNDHENRDGLLRSVEEYTQQPKSWIAYCDFSSLTGSVKCIKAAEGLRGANGMNTDGTLVWANEALGGDIVGFSRNTDNTLTVAKRINLDYLPDNLSFEPATKSFTAAGHPQGLVFQAFGAGLASTAPSWVDVIRPDGTTKRIWSDDGKLLTASTVFEVDLASNVALASGVFQKAGVVRCQVPAEFKN